MIPIMIWGLWIFVFENNPGASPSDKTKIFYTCMPNFIHNNFTLVTLTSSVIALVLASISMTYKSASVKAINIVIIIVSSLIILLQLFTMM